MPTFGAGDAMGVGDVAGQADVQGAAEAFVLGLAGGGGQHAVRVVELPTHGNHAALHAAARLLTHVTRVLT